MNKVTFADKMNSIDKVTYADKINSIPVIW